MNKNFTQKGLQARHFSRNGFSWSWCFGLIFLLFSAGSYGQSSVNYAFSTGTSSLNSMTGSTSLMTGVQDDLGSTVFPIGFNFIYMGNVFSHFSVNSNGQARLHTSSGATAIGGTNVSAYTASNVTLALMAGDNEVGNGMSFLVNGSAPNRKLIIEWNNFYAHWTDPATSGNMQLVLYENTGVFEYIYGNIINSTNTAVSRSIFHSSSNTANASAFVTVAATPTVNTSATSPTTNSFAASVAIANLANRTFTFTPTNTSIASPTNLTFASVSATGMTLNWTAASPTTGIVRYMVQRSTDGGVTFPVSTNVNLGTNTLPVTGLSPGTTYTYRVVAVSEGVESAAVTGSQATTAGATYFWVGAGAGADFNTASNWNTLADGTGTGRTTALATDVLIVDGATTVAGSNAIITLAAAGTCGQFLITNNTAVTVQATTSTTRTITINGGGGFDLSIPAGSTLNLTNANPAAFAFAGTGNTGDISGTYNAGGSTSNTITTTGGTGTLVTVSATGVVNNSIVGSSGCLTGSIATLSFLGGSNYTHSSFTTTNAFIPTATWAATATATLTGGTSSTGLTSGSTSLGNLVINMTGLTVGFNATFSGVTIQGDLTINSTGTGTGFRLVSSGTATVNGNINVNAGTFATFSSTGTINVLGNTTINSGATLNLSLGAGFYVQRGATFTNNGTIIGSNASGVGGDIEFFPPTNAPLSFAGSGIVNPALASLSIDTTGGLTITHTNQIPTLRVNLFNGQVTNSNKITIGSGAALACTIQVGFNGNTFPGGSFDQSPTWNLGTGTFSLLYLQTGTVYTTGFEVPPTRTVTNATINNTSGLTVAGGNLDISGTLTMTAGVINTSTGNVLGLLGTLSGTPSATNMVNGPFNRTFAASRTASGTYGNTTVLPVGKGGAYTPIFIDPTTTAGGAVTFTGEAFTTNSGTLGSGVSTLASTRYEAVPTTGAANLTSAFVRLTDASVVATSKLLQASSAAGSYESLPLVTNFATGILTTATAIPAAGYTGFLSFGEVTPCTAPADQATSILFPVKSTTSLTASYTAAASNPTGYLVVRTAAGTPATNPVNQTNYTAGAAALGGTIAYVGSALTFNQTGLIANTTYDYTIFSYNNSGCAGPVYNTSAPTTASVTTCATATGTPGTPTLSNNASTSFTASWTASSTAGVNYIVDVATNSGFTTFVSGFQGLNVGNALTTNITGLTAATPYWVRVRADLSGCISANSSSLNVTTECSATTTFPYSENFNTYVPACWSEGDLGDLTAGPLTVGASVSDWTSDGYLNNGFTGAAKMNIDAATGSEWLITPFFTIPASHRLKYNVGATQFGATTALTTPWESDDFVELLVSTSTSNWTVLKTYNSANVPSHLGQLDIVDLASFAGQTVRFAFRAFEGATNGSADIDFFIDNFIIEQTPSCIENTVSISTNIAATTATINWTASASNPADGYVWEVRNGATVAASGSTAAGVLTADVTGLSETTAYTVWVRANCGAGDFSIWASGGAFTTPCLSETITSTTPQSRCGTGTVTLGATASGGATVEWYTAATGGTVVGTGTSFTTPSIATTTSYWTQAVLEGTNFNIAPVSEASANLGSFTIGTAAFFSSVNSVKLSSIDIYPSEAGTFTLTMRNNLGATISTQNFTILASEISTTVKKTLVLTNFVVPAGSTDWALSYNLFTNRGAGTYAYPYTNNGFSITGNSQDGTNSIGGTRMYLYNWVVTPVCISSPRTQVTATVNPAPALTLSASTATICNGASSSAITLTAGSTDYDTYNWIPATGVTGNSTSGWIFNPTVNTFYVLEATNAATGCSQIAGIDILVAPTPSNVDITNANATVCSGSVQTLTATGGVVTGATATVSSGTVNLIIPDFSTVGVTQNLVVSAIPAGATITKVDVSFNITHVFSGDIEAYLIAPNGKIVNLIANRGSSGDNFTNTVITSNTAATALSAGSAPFTGTFRADLLSRTATTNFTGALWTPTSNYTETFSDLFAVPNGTWQVRVFDDGSSDIGTLVNCAITITYDAGQITWSPTTNLFTDAACTTAYTGTAATTVFAKPSETITYTATATLGSCSKTDTVTYTVASATYDPALYSGNTPANWSEAPAANKGIVINGNLATSGNLSGCNCVVQSGDVVVNSGHSLVLTNELNVAGGSVTFENNSNLVQTNPVANTGNITYKRNSQPLMRLDYTLWSSPVASQNLKAFSPNTLSPRFYIYDTASATGNTTTNNGTYVTVLTSANESTYNFIGGKGYLIRTPNNHPTTPTVYNGVFTGVPQNGNFSFTLSTAQAGYNLVGNPYPSSIDLNAFFAANAAVQSTVWFWRKSNGAVGDGYVTANNLGYTFPGQTADGATNIAIRSGQGFFVKATGAGSVSFNNGMRSTNTTSTFFRNTASEMPSRVWLQVANSEEVLASALVGYTSAATLGEDAGFDSKPFGNKASLVSLIGTEGYAIQGRSSFEVTDQVALGFEAATAGNYSIAIANKDGVFASGQAIYLQDLAQNFTHDFATGAYNFVSGVGTFNNRFRIVYETQTLGIDDVTANNAYVFDNNGVLTVANTKEEIKAIVIYDIQGRVLLSASDVNANQWKATAMAKNNQVLLVKVTTASGISTTKTVF